jgi:hypothetical protein
MQVDLYYCCDEVKTACLAARQLLVAFYLFPFNVLGSAPGASLAVG